MLITLYAKKEKKKKKTFEHVAVVTRKNRELIRRENVKCVVFGFRFRRRYLIRLCFWPSLAMCGVWRCDQIL